MLSRALRYRPIARGLGRSKRAIKEPKRCYSRHPVILWLAWWPANLIPFGILHEMHLTAGPRTIKLGVARWPAILALYSFWFSGPLTAEETADTMKKLQQRNEMLEERVKSLEEQLDRRMKALEDLVGLKGTGADQKKEGGSESSTAKMPQTPSSKFKAGEWVNSIRVMADVRMRYDELFAPGSAFVTRWRLRPRLRMGAIVSLKDDWELGLRLSSTPSLAKDSGGDPLSTNLTFEDNGSRKPVGVDWVFARWTPLHTERAAGSIAMGKMENPPNFTEDVFDTDYTPEGFAEQFSYKINSVHTVSTYFGQYVLDELASSGKDPLLLVEQLRLESKWNASVSTAFTLSSLIIHHPAGLTTANVPDSNHGNTRTAAGALVNNYNLIIADASVTFNVAGVEFYHGPLPIKLAAEYIQNSGAKDNNIAYAFGPSFGRVSQTGKGRPGDWEISYRYQELQGDSNYEELTASDNGVFYRSRPVGEPGTGMFRPAFFNGLNLRGHAFRMAYAATDALVIDARLWINTPIRTATAADKVQGTRFIFDFVWKL